MTDTWIGPQQWGFVERFACELPADGQRYIVLAEEWIEEDGKDVRVIREWKPTD